MFSADNLGYAFDKDSVEGKVITIVKTIVYDHF